MMTVGYRDYLAARFLLNNDFLIQGLALSCTAVEKYLKSVLIGSGYRRKIHMEKWKEFKSALSLKGVNLFSDLDENFLNLLSKSYSLRYYDSINQNSQYSIIKWQVLGELDYTVHLIENRTSFKNESGVEVKTEYKVDMEKGNPKLFEENYILLGQDKSAFMEREGKFIMVCFDKNGVEVVGEASMRVEQYSGSILVSNSIAII